RDLVRVGGLIAPRSRQESAVGRERQAFLPATRAPTDADDLVPCRRVPDAHSPVRLGPGEMLAVCAETKRDDAGPLTAAVRCNNPARSSRQWRRRLRGTTGILRDYAEE